MNEKYNALFTPWKIGNVEIKNRIVQCSMGGTSLFGWMEPNHFDKEAAYFLLNRAQDGVGLILPGMQCIRDPLGIPGRKWLYQNDQMFKQRPRAGKGPLEKSGPASLGLGFVFHQTRKISGKPLCRCSLEER